MYMPGAIDDEDSDEADDGDSIEAEEDEIREFTEQFAAGISVNARDHSGDTRIMHAAVNDFYHAAVILLEQHGADPNIGDDQGYLPLHYAEDARIIQLLLDHGAEIDAVRNDSGETALMMAAGCRSLYADRARALLRNGASLSLRDKDGHTALVYAEISPCLNQPTLDLLTAVEAAGSWKRYAREPVVQLLSLRYLCLAGRATAPPKLVRCFGLPPVPNAGEARTRRRRAAGSTPLPDEVFAHILGFWHWRT